MPIYNTEKLLNSIIKLKKYGNKRLFKFGVPYLILVIGGSFGLRQFTNLRYEYSTQVTLKPEEFEKQGIAMKKPGEVTLETEFEKLKNLDIDNWSNVRITRPWESPVQQEVTEP